MRCNLTELDIFDQWNDSSMLTYHVLIKVSESEIKWDKNDRLGHGFLQVSEW